MFEKIEESTILRVKQRRKMPGHSLENTWNFCNNVKYFVLPHNAINLMARSTNVLSMMNAPSLAAACPFRSEIIIIGTQGKDSVTF